MKTFPELENEVVRAGYTRTPNPLEDFFLAKLPDPYYRFWRLLWRKTFGWNKTADFLSLRAFEREAGIRMPDVSRAARVFEMVGLLQYIPGKRGRENSHFTVLPNGLPTLEDLAEDGSMDRLVLALKQVTNEEKLVRRSDQKYRMPNGEFCARVRFWWERSGFAEPEYEREYHALKERLDASRV